MRRTLIAVVGTLGSIAASGEDLLQCVHPDIQNGLLFWRPGDYGVDIDSDMPSAIAALSVPSDFEWIASSVRTRGPAPGTVGAFKTGMDSVTALDSAIAALAVDGWEAENATGFSSAFQSQRSRSLCREGDSLSVTAWQADDTSYVTYGVQPSSELGVCETDQQAGPQLPLDSYMPRLDFTAVDSNAFSRGSSGHASGTSTTRSTQVLVDADIETLAGRLAAQLEAQDWRPDAAWLGTVTAGSTWIRESDGTRVTGELDLADVGDSTFEVAFSVTKLWSEALD